MNRASDLLDSVNNPEEILGLSEQAKADIQALASGAAREVAFCPPVLLSDVLFGLLACAFVLGQREEAGRGLTAEE